MLAACTSLQFAPPPPSPQSIHVGISPSLMPLLRDDLNDCALDNPGISMILDVIPNFSLDREVTDIALQIGEPAEGVWEYAFQLGFEEIVLVAHPNSKIALDNLESIRHEFTTHKQNRVILTYPAGHKLRELFKDAVLENEEISPYALVVSNPGEMVESIIRDPGSIGYIPKSWGTDDLQIISIDPIIQKKLQQPVLVTTHQEPVGLIRNLIFCLQNSWDQD